MPFELLDPDDPDLDWWERDLALGDAIIVDSEQTHMCRACGHQFDR